MDINACHMNTAVLVNDLYPFILILCCYSLIQLLDVRNELGNYLLQILKRPLLQRFCQDRMISVCTGFSYNLDRLINCKCLLLNKDTDQFRNDHGRMRIVDLDDCMIIHLTEIKLLLLHLSQDQLSCITYHKVLLINTEQVSCLIRIIRIKEQCQIFLDRFLIKLDTLLYEALIQ